MRRIFNLGRFQERVAAGELTVVIKRSVPATDSSIRNWAPGTLSQELRYYDKENNLVAKTHRYLRPDGTLAASGLEDPKRVVDGQTMHILKLPESS